MKSSPNGPTWCVAVIKAGKWAVAIEKLREQEFKTYAPRIKIRRNVRGKQVRVDEYLFAPYLFIELDARWPGILVTKGISRLLLTSNEKPARVSNVWVQNMKGQEVGGYIDLPKRPRAKKRWNNIGLYQGMSRLERERALLAVLAEAGPV